MINRTKEREDVGWEDVDERKLQEENRTLRGNVGVPSSSFQELGDLKGLLCWSALSPGAPVLQIVWVFHWSVR